MLKANFLNLNFLKFSNEKPYVSLFFMFFFYYALYFNYGIDLDDEGFLLLNSSSILQGQYPIADFMAYQPLSYFGLAGFFKLFGNSVIVERFFLLFFIFTNIFFIYFISSKVLDKKTAFLPALLYGFAPGPWYKVFFVWSLLLPAATWVNAILKNTSLSYFWFGIATGIALSTRYEAGLIIFTAYFFICIVLVGNIKNFHIRLIDNIVNSIYFFFGSLILPVFIFLTYQYNGKWAAFLANSIKYYNISNLTNVINKSGVESSFSFYKLFLTPTLEVIFFFVALVVCFLNITLYFRKVVSNQNKDTYNFIKLIISFLGLLSLLYTKDFVWNSRMLSSFAFVYINFFLLCAYLLKSESKVFSRLIFLVTFFLALIYLDFMKVQNYSGSITTRFSSMKKIDHPKLEYIYVYADQVPDIQQLMFKTKYTNKNDYLISMSESTTMSYLSGLINPTYYRLFLAEFIPDGEEVRAIQKFQNLKVKFFVARKGQFIEGAGPSSKISLYAPMVKKYILDNYKVESLGKRFILFERKDINE